MQTSSPKQQIPVSVPAAGLAAIADPDGVLAIVAMDQRNTLRRMLSAAGRSIEPHALRAFKVDVAAALTPVASGILLDPDFGVPAVLEAGALAAGCGILVAAEPAERGDFQGEPRSHRDPALNAGWVAGMGGAAVKFLVQLHPGRPRQAGEPDLVTEVLGVVRAVVEDCRAVGVPSVIENLVYPLPGEGLTPGARADLIVESARLLAELRPDLLKLEYPGDEAGCRRVAQACGPVPWAVLSAGVAFEEFQQVLRISCDAGGACGFIAGRAIWKEAVDLDGPARVEFLRDVGARRLDECVATVSGRARPWFESRP